MASSRPQATEAGCSWWLTPACSWCSTSSPAQRSPAASGTPKVGGSWSNLTGVWSEAVSVGSTKSAVVSAAGEIPPQVLLHLQHRRSLGDPDVGHLGNERALVADELGQRHRRLDSHQCPPVTPQP